MRLLNVNTMRLEDADPDRGSTKYAILSHVWDKDEVLFADIMDPAGLQRLSSQKALGYQKLIGTCKLALSRGFNHVWVDTCCIDKSSSAELSEAINSMFKWYQLSTECIVYLNDVDLTPDGRVHGFTESRWFSRGWTLQELLAPDNVLFFDRNWQFIGERSQFAADIIAITGIGKKYLRRRDGRSVSAMLLLETAATRMSWAARRKTTRVEDMAYCLLGVFDINMPLLYGEGYKAFCRLQEEIIRVYADHSILAWRGARTSRNDRWPYLAESPANFDTGAYESQHDTARLDAAVTALGLRISVLRCPCRYTYRFDGPVGSNETIYCCLAILDCNVPGDPFARPAILMEPTGLSRLSPISFKRLFHEELVLLKPDGCEILTHPDPQRHAGGSMSCPYLD